MPLNFAKFYSASWYAIAVMACLACASGDTFASSIGVVSGKKDPIHILKLKRVPRGNLASMLLFFSEDSYVGIHFLRMINKEHQLPNIIHIRDYCF